MTALQEPTGSPHRLQRICVFCGAKPGHAVHFRAVATALGKELVKQQIALVYGGGGNGLMGQLADTVLAHGGHATGVIPRHLFTEESLHNGLTELITVDNMHQRKERMATLADGFIALPGGFGTLEELFEAITWHQLGIHQKPVGLLNVDGYYDGLHQFIGHCVATGFIYPKHQSLYAIHTRPDALLDLMRNRNPGR